MKYYIGCSGFSYKEWKGEFYPAKLPQKNWFGYYTTQFNTLELNVTFYRFPTPGMLSNWFDKSPDDFLFAVKAPRLITHYKKFQDTGGLLQDFYGSVSAGLKHKLGPVLFQLPKQLVYSEELLNRLLHALDNHFTNVVEFRDPSWWRKEVQAALTAKNILFCGISHPSLPRDIMLNAKQIYYRYHGIPKLYYSEYDPAVMESMAEALRSPKLQHAYVYFNNTAGGAAIHNARQLKQFLGLE